MIGTALCSCGNWWLACYWLCAKLSLLELTKIFKILLFFKNQILSRSQTCIAFFVIIHYTCSVMRIDSHKLDRCYKLHLCCRILESISLIVANCLRIWRNLLIYLTSFESSWCESCHISHFVRIKLMPLSIVELTYAPLNHKSLKYNIDLSSS